MRSTGGKPIFYSLGNFIFQNDLIRKHPQDIYDKVGQGLTMGSTPADMYDARSRNDTRGFPSDVAYWESVLGSLEFAGGEFRRATLYPLYLGWDNPRSQRGRPTLAREMREILRGFRLFRNLTAPISGSRRSRDNRSQP